MLRDLLPPLCSRERTHRATLCMQDGFHRRGRGEGHKTEMVYPLGQPVLSQLEGKLYRLSVDAWTGHEAWGKRGNIVREASMLATCLSIFPGKHCNGATLGHN